MTNWSREILANQLKYIETGGRGEIWPIPAISMFWLLRLANLRPHWCAGMFSVFARLANRRLIFALRDPASRRTNLLGFEPRLLQRLDTLCLPRWTLPRVRQAVILKRPRNGSEGQLGGFSPSQSLYAPPLPRHYKPTVVSAFWRSLAAAARR